MTKSKTVSLVVPAYNHARYLEECIESVLAQTYQDIELIVIDDGSTDSTKEILTLYGDRFRWLSQTNAGQSATLTTGWAMSTGTVLGYLSADDILRPDAVARAVRALDNASDLVMVYPDFELIDENSVPIRIIETPEYTQQALVLDLVCQAGPGAFFKRDAYLKAGPWDTALRQNPDLDFWLRLSLQGRFFRIPEILAGFRVHADSTTYRAAATERAEEPFRISESFACRTDLPAWMRSHRRRIMATGHLASAQLHIKAGRFAFALTHLRAALRASPGTFFSRRSVHLTGSALKSYGMHQLKKYSH